MNRGAQAWVALGWVGFVLLPWHLVSGEWYELFIGYAAGGLRSAAGLALTGSAWWLGPIVVPLFAATWPLVVRYRKEQAARWLVAAGMLGLALIVAQGFAIGLRGWSWSLLAALFGAPGPNQAGLGSGAGLTAAAFLMLTCYGLAGRGWCRGDAFVVGAIGSVVALTVVFVFYPVTTILVSALQNNDGAFAPG